MKEKVKEHRKIEKKGLIKKWKVDSIKVKATDDNEVTWTCDDSDFVIWFPPAWNPLVGTNQSGKIRSFTAQVRQDVLSGQVYQYSIFCYADNEIAEGSSSPPEMIIQ